MNYQVLPDLSNEDYAALKADIAARGVMVPVEYDGDGNIIDGHHRVRACGELGIADWPRITRSYESDAAKLTQARKLNIARRHLDQAAKRLLIEAELLDNPARSNRQVAAGLGVSDNTVGAARERLEHGAQIAHHENRVGRDGVVQPAHKPPTSVAQLHFPGVDGSRALKNATKEIRAVEADESRTVRIDRLAEISKGNAELNVAVRYPVIYADPPWRYENPPMGGSNRSIENHYPTMSLEEICAMNVADLATDDAILYLWATAPKLAECMKVIEAWGFDYRTNFVWIKDKIGMGYHARNQHEILLVAKRGSIPPPAVADRVSSVVHGDRTEHSAKPIEFYELIESFYPTLPKIELFSRSPREGWAAFGNQAVAA